VEVILTLEEVASFLRSEPSVIEGLLQSGDLQGFKLGNEWRIPAAAVTSFLEHRLKDQELESLRRALENPRVWAREVRRDPKIREWVEGSDFSTGTMGEFLQQGLAALEAEEGSDNVLPFKSQP